jgi:2-oxoacid:acceptor oxidoreductase delta subunit (pyruvate/2-ketoisovalerate family)
MARECLRDKPERKSVSGARRRPSSRANRGYTEQDARREAGYCLSRRECESCEICALFCPEICITRDEKTGEVVIDLDYCKGCGICAAVCPKGAIQMVLEDGR